MSLSEDQMHCQLKKKTALETLHYKYEGELIETGSSAGFYGSEVLL